MIFEKLKNKNVVLCDTMYHKASKLTDYNDYISIIYKDTVTNEKKVINIKNPEIDLYTVKEDERKFKKARHFLETVKLDKTKIKYKDRLAEIAKVAGPNAVKYFKEASYKDRKNILKYPYCLGADIDIETIYRQKWKHTFGTDVRYKPTKCFLDIEVDQINYEGNFAKHGECPVNAISVVDAENKTVHTFLLDNVDNPLISDFKQNIPDFIKYLHDLFDESYGVFDYKIYMFSEERELLKKTFTLIHSMKKDFCLIWNMGFDIPYLIDRLYNLGEDPNEIMCHSDFPTKSLYYFEDTRVFDFDKKKDYFNVASYTHFIDQLILYASMRKSKGALAKYSLGAVAQHELKDNKLDYSDAGNIRTLPYENYIRFVAYNIKDTLLQYGIDNKVKDVDNFYLSSYLNCVPYKDTLKQTVSFRGLAYDELLEENLILGHNVNFDNYSEKDDDDDDDTFEGAINGDPLKNEHTGLKIFGINSKFLFGDSIDMDFSSMYPNSIVAFNIFGTTMIGKLYVVDGEKYLVYDEDAGKEFVEDMISHNYIHTGTKWFNLPTIETIMQKVIEQIDAV